MPFVPVTFSPQLRKQFLYNFLSDSEAVERASSLRLKEKLEKYCPVSASLNCPVRLALEIVPRADQQGEGTPA